MIDLSQLLPKLLRQSGSNTELAVKLAWSRAAGRGLRRHAIPFRLGQKTLIVSVEDALWQRQLQSMAPELIFRINRLLGEETVEFIEFRVNPAALNRVPPPLQAASPEVTPAPSEIILAAASIADAELRNHFVRAAENCIARRDSLARD